MATVEDSTARLSVHIERGATAMTFHRHYEVNIYGR